MATIKIDNGMDLDVLSIWSMVGHDLEYLIIIADSDARHELAIVDGRMMPYATQISVMPGELADIFTITEKSLFQVDIIVFGNSESEIRYLSLNENGHLFLEKESLQGK